MSERYADQTAELKALCARVVERARKKGAREAEAFSERSRTASATVANGEIEELSEAASKGVGLRLFVDGRLGFASTTDFAPEAIETLIDRAIALARASAPDEANGLPTRRELSLTNRPRVGRLFDDAVAGLDPSWKLSAAFEMERAARAEDGRCTRFEGSGAGEAVVEYAIANSHGLSDAERGTHVYLWCSPVAGEGDGLQTSSWSDHRRHLAEVESPESVGREAARRTVRMLGARKPESARVPVIFDPNMAAGFFGALARAASGELVYKRSSFLAGRLGQAIASPLVTLVDDGRIEGALGASAFDGEGLVTRSLPVLENGVLKNFFYDVRTARKAGAKPTASARRGYASLPAIAARHLVVTPGTQSPEGLIRGVKRGLFVTSMLGSGANVITGDYSRGANGLWIENGELTFPVQEATVAGHLDEMLKSIDALGSDLQRRGGVWAPSIRFAELAVGGR
jgi:PmbA protein